MTLHAEEHIAHSVHHPRHVSAPGPSRIVRLPCPLTDECSQCLSRRLPPADAERVAGRVGVHLMPLVAVQIACSEQAGTEPHRLFVCLLRVFDV